LIYGPKVISAAAQDLHAHRYQIFTPYNLSTLQPSNLSIFQLFRWSGFAITTHYQSDLQSAIQHIPHHTNAKFFTPSNLSIFQLSNLPIPNIE
jgi:hypothetical protein